MKNSNNCFSEKFFPRLNCLQCMWTTYLTHIYFLIPLFSLSFFSRPLTKVVIGAVKSYWLTIYSRTRKMQKVRFHNLEKCKNKLVDYWTSGVEVSSLWDFARLVVSNLLCLPLHYLSKNVSTFSRSIVCTPPLLILT